MLSEKLSYQNLYIGYRPAVLIKSAITKVQLVKYAEASGDFNPLHTEDNYAQEAGFDGVIAHGMLVMGFLSEYIMNLTGSTAHITNFKVRFESMTQPGDVITCQAVVTAIYEMEDKKYVELYLQANKEPEEIVGSGKVTLCYSESYF